MVDAIKSKTRPISLSLIGTAGTCPLSLAETTAFLVVEGPQVSLSNDQFIGSESNFLSFLVMVIVTRSRGAKKLASSPTQNNALEAAVTLPRLPNHIKIIQHSCLMSMVLTELLLIIIITHGDVIVV